MRLHITVRGRVQGIGYRFFVVETARRLHLTGWVRNCSNGEVECQVQGNQTKVNLFVEELRSGHRWARVEHLIQEDLPDILEERSFDIR